jgi:hypothetical protein
MGLLAGAERVEITPPCGVDLMGYGAREGVATGVHDPLYARALALRQTDKSDRASGLVLVVADLCLITPAQAGWVRQEIGSRTGLSPGSVLVSCTHTHSGPDTGLMARMTGREDPPHVAPLLGLLVEAGCRAYEAASPSHLCWERTRAQIGRNRRRADGPLDPEVLVLHVQDARGASRAVLYSHACHATVLGHDNLEISADWPGVASNRIEQETGGLALFLLGAHADIDPRTRGLKDLAITGQSSGLGFDAVEILGAEVAEAVLGTLAPEAEPGRAAENVPVCVSSGSIGLPIHLGNQPEETARAELKKRKAELAEWLDVPLEEFPRLSALESRIRARTHGLPTPELREWIARGRLYVRDRTARHWTEGAPVIDVEAQVLRIGEGALLALPVEPTAAVGLDWKERAQRRVPFSSVVGIGNGWLRYLPHPDDLADPLGHQRYEILSSLLAPGACEKLLELGETLLEQALAA